MVNADVEGAADRMVNPGAAAGGRSGAARGRGGADAATGETLGQFAAGTPGHRQLFGIAYRMLGSVHDAEDALQEGFRRWQELTAEQRSLIREPVAWLTRVISRICLDELGTARARRESYTGFWLPEPVLGSAAGAIGGAVGACRCVGCPRSQAADPADVVTLDESVSMALLVAMEQLSPAERVSLILHDVFGVPFAEIADIVGRTPEASRQLATSARRNIRRQPRFDVQGAERDRVVLAFAKACRDGDVVGPRRGSRSERGVQGRRRHGGDGGQETGGRRGRGRPLSAGCADPAAGTRGAGRGRRWKR